MKFGASRRGLSTALFVFLQSAASGSLAECGVLPIAPEVVDGREATIKQLVSNSKEVRQFLNKADRYLSCHHQLQQSNTEQSDRKSRSSRRLSRAERELREQAKLLAETQRRAMISGLTRLRHQIHEQLDRQFRLYEETHNKN